MAEFRLTPTPAIQSPPVESGDTRLAGVEPEGVHTLVLRPDDPDRLAAEIGAAIAPLPRIGGSSAAGSAGTLLRPTRERAYLIGAVPEIGSADCVYALDQTGFWAMMSLTGPGARAVLERSWKPDLEPGLFGVGAVARSTMAAIPAILWHAEAQEFRIMTPRSYAVALYDELARSLRWVL